MYSGGLVELVLLDREGRDKLIIPASLLAHARLFCESEQALRAALERLTQLPGDETREVEREELEVLAGALADLSFASEPGQEAGILEWVPPSLAHALVEESEVRKKSVKGSAALAAALRRGLLICHLCDRWIARKPSTGRR